MTLISPGGTTKNMKFDGKDYPVQGQYVFPGTLASGRRVNEHTVEVTDKTNGRVVDKQQIELSPDLKTLDRNLAPVGSK